MIAADKLKKRLLICLTVVMLLASACGRATPLEDVQDSSPPDESASSKSGTPTNIPDERPLVPPDLARPFLLPERAGGVFRFTPDKLTKDTLLIFSTIDTVQHLTTEYIQKLIDCHFDVILIDGTARYNQKSIDPYYARFGEDTTIVFDKVRDTWRFYSIEVSPAIAFIDKTGQHTLKKEFHDEMPIDVDFILKTIDSEGENCQ